MLACKSDVLVRMLHALSGTIRQARNYAILAVVLSVSETWMFDDALEAGFYMWSASMGFLATTFTFLPRWKERISTGRCRGGRAVKGMLGHEVSSRSTFEMSRSKRSIWRRYASQLSTLSKTLKLQHANTLSRSLVDTGQAAFRTRSNGS